MTAYSWASAATGNWKTGALWSPAGGPPTSLDSATISAIGSAYFVQVNTADAAGALTLSGTLTQSGGTISLNAGATVSGGTINSTAGTIKWLGGTLSGVTYDGPLNLTSGASLHLANGSQVVGSGGSGPGTINVTNA